MLIATIAAAVLAPAPSYNWQVETAWIDNVTQLHTKNGNVVTPAMLPTVSVAGNVLTVNDSTVGIWYHKTRAPLTSQNETRQVAYQVHFKIRWTGVGAPPSLGSSGSFTWDEYTLIGGAATLGSGVGSSCTFGGTANAWANLAVNLPAGFTITGGGSTPFGFGSNSYSYSGGSSTSTIHGTDGLGPYWILTTGGGFFADVDFNLTIGNGGVHGADIGVQSSTKFTLTHHNGSDPVNPF